MNQYETLNVSNSWASKSLHHGLFEGKFYIVMNLPFFAELVLKTTIPKVSMILDPQLNPFLEGQIISSRRLTDFFLGRLHVGLWCPPSILEKQSENLGLFNLFYFREALAPVVGFCFRLCT